MRQFYCFLMMSGLFLGTAANVSAAVSAKADIRGLGQNGEIQGLAVLEETADGLKIQVELQNVPPGEHGFHIHEYGDCAGEGKAAGGHYNPAAAEHGYLPEDDFHHAHAGDFGNIDVDAEGTGKKELLIPGLGLQNGIYNVAGRAFILHEKKDDFGQPTGNAGGRIACGPIVLIEGDSVQAS